MGVSPAATASRDGRGHVVVERVSKTFETQRESVEALREVSLDIAEHEFVALIGPSGCGKSTLLRLIGGLIPPSGGTLAIRGRSPLEAPHTKDIGFVFPPPALLPWRAGAANVQLPLPV